MARCFAFGSGGGAESNLHLYVCIYFQKSLRERAGEKEGVCPCSSVYVCWRRIRRI